MQMARDAGIGWARQEFIWAELEPEQGNFDWTKYDEIVDLFRRNNIQVIARLDAASATTRCYPYWHQYGFDRNPSPVG